MSSSIELESGQINQFHAYSLLSDEENSDQPNISTNVELLMEHCAKILPVKLFLRSTGNYWPLNSDNKWWSLLDYFYFGAARASTVATIVTCFIYVFNKDEVLAHAIEIVVIIRTLSIIPAQYSNLRRLLKPAEAMELLVLGASNHAASLYGIVVLGTTIASSTLFAGSIYGLNNSGFLLAEFFIGASLSFNLLFFVVDAKVSILLLDELHQLADDDALSLKNFESTRLEIHRRVKESRLAGDLLVIPCMASVAIILVLAFQLQLDNYQSLYIDIGFICLMIKELIFAIVAFIFVARVNARADELTFKLNRSLFGIQALSDDEFGKVVHKSDLQRTSICISSILEPISFTLLFKRVSWKNVILGTGGFVITVFVAIIKSFLKKNASI